jgi:ankyrin repeat protein
MVKTLIECGADVNNYNDIGHPPIVTAILSRNFEFVKLLVEKGAKCEGIALQYSLSILDYSILFGQYESATLIYSRINDKRIKTPEEYHAAAKNFRLRYFNYSMFIEGLLAGKPRAELGDFY